VRLKRLNPHVTECEVRTGTNACATTEVRAMQTGLGPCRTRGYLVLAVAAAGGGLELLWIELYAVFEDQLHIFDVGDFC